MSQYLHKLFILNIGMKHKYKIDWYKYYSDNSFTDIVSREIVLKDQVIPAEIQAYTFANDLKLDPNIKKWKCKSAEDFINKHSAIYRMFVEEKFYNTHECFTKPKKYIKDFLEYFKENATRFEGMIKLQRDKRHLPENSFCRIVDLSTFKILQDENGVYFT